VFYHMKAMRSVIAGIAEWTALILETKMAALR
jgi:hypothetical protein